MTVSRIQQTPRFVFGESYSMVMLYQGHIDLGGGASSEAGGAAAGPECRGIKLTDESIQLHPFGFDTWIVNKIFGNA